MTSSTQSIRQVTRCRRPSKSWRSKTSRSILSPSKLVNITSLTSKYWVIVFKTSFESPENNDCITDYCYSLNWKFMAIGSFEYILVYSLFPPIRRKLFLFLMVHLVQCTYFLLVIFNTVHTIHLTAKKYLQYHIQDCFHGYVHCARDWCRPHEAVVSVLTRQNDATHLTKATAVSTSQACAGFLSGSVMERLGAIWRWL